jgi:hypothetical protein
MALCARCSSQLRIFQGSSFCDTCTAFLTPRLASFRAALEHLLADNELDANEEAWLRQHQHALGLRDADIAEYLPLIQRKIAARELFRNWATRGVLPAVRSPVVLQQGEVAGFSSGAKMFESQTTYVHTPGQRGVIVRPMGIRIRVGATRGHTAPVTSMALVGQGALTITNRRVVFSGGRLAVVPLSEIVSYEAFSDGIRVHVAHESTPKMFALQEGEWAACVLNCVTSHAGVASSR